MRFSQDFIDKVMEANNLVDLIGQYTPLKPTGSNLMGLCPFPDHNEKSPSFSVSASKQLFHCFGCKKSGNIIGWLQQYNGMSFPEAIEHLADRAGIAMPTPELKDGQRQQYQQQQDKRKQLLRTNEFARNYFRSQLRQGGSELRRYLQSRRLSEEICDSFQIGYAPDSWDALGAYLQRESIPATVAEQLGLIKRRQKGDGYFDIFRHRLIFPILSASGEVLGFGARVLRSEEQPKYLNSPESPIFHKGKTLYGLHETAKHILSEDAVIVVEGYMDLIALFSAGIKNTVANLGTAFTEDHARLIKRYTKNVILLFDGDEAGQRAADRAVGILYGQALYPKILQLPDQLDPDEFLATKGVEAFRQALDSTQDLFYWYLARVLQDFDRSPTGQIKAIDRIYPLLAQVADTRLRALYLRETAERLGVEESWLRDTLRQMWKKTKQPLSPSPAPLGSVRSASYAGATDPENINNTEYLDVESWQASELEMLKICLANEALWQDFRSGQAFAYLSSESAKEIFAEMDRLYGQRPSDFDRLPGFVVKKLRNPSVVTQILNGDFYEDTSRVQKLYEDCLKKLRTEATRMELKQLREGLKQGLPEDKLQRYMELVSSHKSDKRTNSKTE